MSKKIIVQFVSLCLLHTPVFACSGSAIGSAGNATTTQVSVQPVKEGSPTFSQVVNFLSATVLNMLETLVVRTVSPDPITGTLLGEAVKVENAVNMNATIEAVRRSARTLTINAPAEVQLQAIEASERAQFSTAP